MARTKKAPEQQNSLTKKELQDELKKLSGAFKARDSKETLIKLLDKTKRQRFRRGSSKEEIRRLFDANGYVTKADLDHIARQLGIKRESVQTALSDLQNPKWAQGPTVIVEKEGDRYVAR